MTPLWKLIETVSRSAFERGERDKLRSLARAIYAVELRYNPGGANAIRETYANLATRRIGWYWDVVDLFDNCRHGYTYGDRLHLRDDWERDVRAEIELRFPSTTNIPR